MTFMQFVMFALATIGLTNIMIYGKILEGMRDLLEAFLPPAVYEVLECYQCMGFWTGMLTGYIVLTSNILGVLACGFAGSFLSHFAALIVEYIESNMMIALHDDYVEEEE